MADRTVCFAEQEDEPSQSPLDPTSSPLPPPAKDLPSSEEEVLKIVEESSSLKVFQAVLKEYYEPMETWFLRTSTEKALRLDTPDTSLRPHLSSAPDDVFYLLKLVLYRLIHSSSLVTLERMIVTVEEIVEEGFLGGIKRKMDGVYAGVRSAGLADAKIGAGKGTEGERLEKEMRGTFLVRILSLSQQGDVIGLTSLRYPPLQIYANDLDVSAGHMERLIKEITESDALSQAFLEEELPVARSKIRGLSSLTEKFRSTLKVRLFPICSQASMSSLTPLFLPACSSGWG